MMELRLETDNRKSRIGADKGRTLPIARLAGLQAPNTNRVPVDERMNLSGIVCCAIERNVSPEQCIGMIQSGLMSLRAAAVSR
jgi:hypothetical protein